MFKRILKWFKDRKDQKERDKEYKKKVKEMKKRDPFTYKH